MKRFTRFLAILAVPALMWGVTACSQDDIDTTPERIGEGNVAVAGESENSSADAESQGPAASDDESGGFSCIIDGVTARPNTPAADVIAALGDGYELFEAPSCAFQGTDRVYTYSSVIIRTYPMSDVDYISAIEFRNDMLSTREGIFIGNSEDEIRAAYGEPDNVLSGGIEYTKDDVTLSFIIRDGVVEGISYIAITE